MHASTKLISGWRRLTGIQIKHLQIYCRSQLGISSGKPSHFHILLYPRFREMFLSSHGQISPYPSGFFFDSLNGFLSILYYPSAQLWWVQQSHAKICDISCWYSFYCRFRGRHLLWTVKQNSQTFKLRQSAFFAWVYNNCDLFLIARSAHAPKMLKVNTFIHLRTHNSTKCWQWCNSELEEEERGSRIVKRIHIPLCAVLDFTNPS